MDKSVRAYQYIFLNSFFAIFIKLFELFLQICSKS